MINYLSAVMDIFRLLSPIIIALVIAYLAIGLIKAIGHMIAFQHFKDNQ